jgi:hypothetical protein
MDYSVSRVVNVAVLLPSLGASRSLALSNLEHVQRDRFCGGHARGAVRERRCHRNLPSVDLVFLGGARVGRETALGESLTAHFQTKHHRILKNRPVYAASRMSQFGNGPVRRAKSSCPEGTAPSRRCRKLLQEGRLTVRRRVTLQGLSVLGSARTGLTGLPWRFPRPHSGCTPPSVGQTDSLHAEVQLGGQALPRRDARPPVRFVWRECTGNQP